MRPNNTKKIKVPTKRLLLLQLKAAIIVLDKELFTRPRVRYTVRKKPLNLGYHELITVGRINNNIKFEVRDNEHHHNVAHFHVTIRGKGSGSYRIDDLTAIQSDLSNSDEKIVLEWAKANKQILTNIWNEYHGYRIIVA